LAVPHSAIDSKPGKGEPARAVLTPDLAHASLTLAAGSRTQRIKGVTLFDVPAVPSVDAPPLACVPAVTLKQAVAFVAEALGGRGDKVIQSVIKAGTLTLTACDGYRIHRATVAIEATGDYNAWLPASSWQALARLVGPDDGIQVCANEKHVAFKFGRVELVTEQAAMSGRSVDTILESEPVWSVTINAAELQNAVKHVRIINHETIQFKTTRYRDDRPCGACRPWSNFAPRRPKWAVRRTN
jgi:hypothetical protein